MSYKSGFWSLQPIVKTFQASTENSILLQFNYISPLWEYICYWEIM